jgi:hypothetical protein
MRSGLNWLRRLMILPNTMKSIAGIVQGLRCRSAGNHVRVDDLEYVKIAFVD